MDLIHHEVFAWPSAVISKQSMCFEAIFFTIVCVHNKSEHKLCVKLIEPFSNSCQCLWNPLILLLLNVLLIQSNHSTTNTHHFQEVSLKCGDSGQWLHLERAAGPVNQTAVAVGFLQAEAKASRQDLEMANCKSSYAQRLRNKLCALTTSCLDLDR